MTPRDAKTRTAEYLAQHGLAYERLTAQTVSFEDLARGSSVFVTVHGFTPDPGAAELQTFARRAGFRVQFA